MERYLFQPIQHGDLSGSRIAIVAQPLIDPMGTRVVAGRSTRQRAAELVQDLGQVSRSQPHVMRGIAG